MTRFFSIVLPLILGLTSCLKEDELQKVTIRHSQEIILPPTFADTSSKLLEISSEGFVLDAILVLNNTEGFDTTKVMYSAILKSAELSLDDSLLVQFNEATQKLILALERNTYNSTIAEYHNDPLEGRFTELSNLAIPPVSLLAFLNNYEDENITNDTVFLKSYFTLVDSILDSVHINLNLEIEGTFGSNEHRQ